MELDGPGLLAISLPLLIYLYRSTPETGSMGKIPGRDALVSRFVPSMILSNGSSSSKTPAPTSLIESESDAVIRSQKCFVTGDSGTLGLHSCDALLEHGLQGLMIFDINLKNSKNEIAQMQAKFPTVKILTQKVHATDKAAVQKAMEETIWILELLVCLVCFVGIVGCVETLEMSVSQWWKVLDVNMTGLSICAQAAAQEVMK